MPTDAPRPVIDAVCRVMGVTERTLAGRSRCPRVVLARGVVVYVARRMGGEPPSYPTLARAMGRAHSGLIRAERRVRDQVATLAVVDGHPVWEYVERVRLVLHEGQAAVAALAPVIDSEGVNQATVAEFIRERGRPVRAAELIEVTGASWSSLQSLLLNMTEDGLLRRIDRPRRRPLYALAGAWCRCGRCGGVGVVKSAVTGGESECAA